MIEVELKIPLSEENLSLLTKGATLIGTKSHTDSYFDTSDYKLSMQAVWLRKRNGRFELKWPATGIAKRTLTERYEEFETDDEIRQKINLPKESTFEEDLQKAGYLPFAEYTVTRTTYKNGEFKIDIDEMSYGYKMCEVELEVESVDKVEEAEIKIKNFLEGLGIDPNKFATGKMVEYLRRYRKEHLDLLVANGAIKKIA